MSLDVHISLDGEPETIQTVADLFERAFPGVIQWDSVGEPSSRGITLRGVGIPSNLDQEPPLRCQT